MSNAILIIAPPATAEPIANALRSELDASVEIAPQRRAGLAALRRSEYAVVLLEESLAHRDARSADVLYQNAGGAPVVELSLHIAQTPFILRQVRSALAHRAHDGERARAAATAELQSKFGASVTGILLESQLALREATPSQAPKLQHVVDLARDLRKHLRA